MPGTADRNCLRRPCTLPLARYTVAPGVFASPSSSPRFLARNAETLARFMHRSEQ